jgi:hypothetical protein
MQSGPQQTGQHHAVHYMACMLSSLPCEHHADAEVKHPLTTSQTWGVCLKHHKTLLPNLNAESSFPTLIQLVNPQTPQDSQLPIQQGCEHPVATPCCQSHNTASPTVRH